MKEKHNAICDSTDSICTYMYEGSNVRDYFRNYCLINVGKFSCAVDCFLELCYFVFRNHLQNITCNDFFQVIYELCNQRENLGAVEIKRKPVWSLIRGRCPSFSTLGFSKNLHYWVRGKHQPRYLDPGFHRATRSPAGWI